jgi:HRDC domain
MTTRDRQVGLMLLAFGALLLLNNLSGADAGWLWVGAIAAVFLYGHRARHEPGLAVPGGVLAGVAVGILLENITPFDGVFLFGLAGGFYLITVLEPRIHAWALWPAGVLSVIAGMVLISQNAWLFTALLIVGGLYLLNRGRQNATHAHPVIAHQTSSPVTDDSDDAVRIRFDHLAAWRTRQASTENRLPTDVIRNDQLERIARERPTTLENLRLILDSDQVERYGQALLDQVR